MTTNHYGSCICYTKIRAFRFTAHSDLNFAFKLNHRTYLLKTNMYCNMSQNMILPVILFIVGQL